MCHCVAIHGCDIGLYRAATVRQPFSSLWNIDDDDDDDDGIFALPPKATTSKVPVKAEPTAASEGPPSQAIGSSIHIPSEKKHDSDDDSLFGGSPIKLPPSQKANKDPPKQVLSQSPPLDSSIHIPSETKPDSDNDSLFGGSPPRKKTETTVGKIVPTVLPAQSQPLDSPLHIPSETKHDSDNDSLFGGSAPLKLPAPQKTNKDPLKDVLAQSPPLDSPLHIPSKKHDSDNDSLFGGSSSRKPAPPQKANKDPLKDVLAQSPPPDSSIHIPSEKKHDSLFGGSPPIKKTEARVSKVDPTVVPAQIPSPDSSIHIPAEKKHDFDDDLLFGGSARKSAGAHGVTEGATKRRRGNSVSGVAMLMEDG